MKKAIKIISLVLLSIIGAYSVFVIEESIRLSKDVDARPLIINKVEIECDECVNSSTVVYSLGFKLVNKFGNPQVDDENSEVIVVGQEFWLFDTFMLWGWIS